MHRTDAEGHVGNQFSDGDRLLGIPGTVVDAAWLNAVQEEICNLLTQRGVVLAKGTNTQLRDAMKPALAAAWGTVRSLGGTLTVLDSSGIESVSVLGSPQRGISVAFPAGRMADGNYCVVATPRVSGTLGLSLRYASPAVGGFDLLAVDHLGDPVNISAQDVTFSFIVFGARP